MTLNIRSLPASKLKQLKDKKGGVCTIMYTGVPGGLKQVLLEGYPKQVGIAFSKLFSNQFPPLNKIKLADLTKPTSNEVLIVGGRTEVHKEILSWMLSCCTGAGLQDFPTFETKKLTKYYLVKESAQILQIPFVIDLMAKRMNGIAAVQIHSEDIRALYGLLGRDHPLVKEIVAKTATLMAKGPTAMKAYNVYITLTQELEEFKEDITPVVDLTKVQSQERERQIERIARKEKQLAKWNAQKKFAYAARKKTEAVASRSQESSTVQKVIRAEKRGNGRLVLPLADLGVGANDDFFKPMQTVSLRPWGKERKGSNEGKKRKGSGAEDAGKSGIEKDIEKDGSEGSTGVETAEGSSANTTLVDDGKASAVDDVVDEAIGVVKTAKKLDALETGETA